MKISLLPILILLSACTYKTSAPISNGLEGNWILITLSDYQGEIIKKPTLNFEANKINGNNGCNNYFGELVGNSKSFKFDKIGATEMYCIDNNANLIETKFNQMLNNAKSAKIENNQLNLFSDNGVKIASFVKAAQ